MTLILVHEGVVFTLDGFDDQCGASERASATGTAFFNPDGTVGIGLTVVLAPGGDGGPRQRANPDRERERVVA